jgi:predicted ribosome quality control (RQC) complex YloA/Tae2 family protein
LLQQACTESRGWVYQGPQTAFVYPVVLQSLTGFDRACYPDLSSAAAHVAHLDLSTSTLEQDRRRLLEAVRRAQATIEKRVAERTEGHQRAQDAESIRRQAETLLTYVHLVPQGAAAVELTDPHNHDDTLSIHLDPRLSAQQNAQKLFARYKKLVAMQRRIETLLQAARREQHYLAGLLDQVQQADNAEQMTDLEAEIIQQGYIKQARQPIRHKAPKLQVHSAEVMGYTIMWGTSGLQNDKLLRLATPEDIWLHTRKTPGGHVLIRTNGQPDHIPDEVVVAAAAHAARLSKRRTDTRVAVDYALIKHVRRLKGTPPGYVHYTTHKTVHVDPANGLELFNR